MGAPYKLWGGGDGGVQKKIKKLISTLLLQKRLITLDRQYLVIYKKKLVK